MVFLCDIVTPDIADRIINLGAHHLVSTITHPTQKLDLASLLIIKALSKKSPEDIFQYFCFGKGCNSLRTFLH